MGSVGHGLMAIAMAILSIALITLLVNRSDNASKLISTGGGVFNELLQTVTLQNSSFGFGQGFGTFGGIVQ